MPWIVNDELKRIIYLEGEAAPLLKYGGYDDYEYVEEAVNIVDIIRDMDDDATYSAALHACCKDTFAYVKDHFRNVLEYGVWDSDYRCANSLYHEIADLVTEEILQRGMARMKLIPVVGNVTKERK